jgi:SAM-dependent methyltransferase
MGNSPEAFRAGRAEWDRRYREKPEAWREPDRFLEQAYREYIAPLFPQGGRALDLAGGAGRHAIWLARHNWQVTLADISETGIALAKQNAGSLARRMEFRAFDLRAFCASPDPYELVLVFFYLDRALFPEMVKSLRPGGILVYKTYTKVNPKPGHGPTDPAFLLQPGELLRSFSQLQILFYRESIRERGVAELVARNP